MIQPLRKMAFALRFRGFARGEALIERQARDKTGRDLADPLHRPRDGSFWQMDLVFVKKDRPEFTINKY
ncbi:MAG: hypothetical protein NTX50_26480 [Candidatus Sumerlaeota bacterium]|nr:hypothetical protein [Candidatus Sumerlaeota bacterium]